jgi:hypothetical protein
MFYEFIKRELAKRVICTDCGCTLATFAERCIADLSARCPGFEAIEAAERRFLTEHNL